jgi:iron(III) transport system substrate-binding protein
VSPGYESHDGRWVGVSGRARVVVYNPEVVQESQIPPSLFDLTGPEWEGRVGWAPPNASFQVMVTALRAISGEDAARQWLEDMLDNDVQSYGNNIQVLQAVDAGEIDIGLANHYYLHGLKRSDPDFSVENHFPNNTSDAGSLIMVSAVGILSETDNLPAAELFVSYLLSPAAQQYFATETSEYPLTTGTISPPNLPPLEELEGPSVDLADLNDIQGTLQLLRETGVLP